MSAREKPSGAPLVSILVGSSSDAEPIAACRRALDRFGIPHEAKVLSAHRVPRELVAYIETLEERGIKLVIAAAGMAAHLPGVIAGHTRLPVLGVPLAAGPLSGVDALLSVAQMPGGVPVACLGVGSSGCKNAAYLAARILALHDNGIRERLVAAMKEDSDKVLQSSLPDAY